jgi:hypothetical protein
MNVGALIDLYCRLVFIRVEHNVLHRPALGVTNRTGSCASIVTFFQLTSRIGFSGNASTFKAVDGLDLKFFTDSL